MGRPYCGINPFLPFYQDTVTNLTWLTGFNFSVLTVHTSSKSVSRLEKRTAYLALSNTPTGGHASGALPPPFSESLYWIVIWIVPPSPIVPGLYPVGTTQLRHKLEKVTGAEEYLLITLDFLNVMWIVYYWINSLNSKLEVDRLHITRVRMAHASGTAISATRLRRPP